MGKGEEARKYFAKAIDVADTPEHKTGARRAMAMSYAFEGNCKKNRRVRTTGIRLLRQREEILSTGRDCGRGGSRLPRLRRFGYLVQVVRDRSRHGTEGTGNQTRPSKPVELSVGARAGPHRGSARRPSRSAKACCCGKGHPR